MKYIRPDSRSSEAQQRAILDAFKLDSYSVVKLYVEAVKRRGGEYPEREKMVKSLRPGDLVVVTDLHRLASRSEELTEAIKAIRSRGLNTVVVEARKGRRSDCLTDYDRMRHEASQVYSGHSMTTIEARERGTKGGENSPVTKPAPGRMPWGKMLAVIKVSTTMADAVAAINASAYVTPVSRVWLYREFKARKIDPKSLLKARRAKAKQIQSEP